MASLSLDYVFDKTVKVARRLDHLYDVIDDWLFDGKFEQCDELLQILCENYLNDKDNVVMLIGALTISIHRKDILKNRAILAKELYEKVKNWHDKAYADRLMEGLI